MMNDVEHKQLTRLIMASLVVPPLPPELVRSVQAARERIARELTRNALPMPEDDDDETQ